MAGLLDFAKRAMASVTGPSLAFTWSPGDRPAATTPDGLWAMHRGVRRDDGKTAVSVFVFDVARHRALLPLARNVLRRARTIRHPMALRFVDAAETDAQLILGTEAVEPYGMSAAADGGQGRRRRPTRRPRPTASSCSAGASIRSRALCAS
jgi:hypothetical protein